MKTKLFAIVIILIGLSFSNPAVAEKEERNVSPFSEIALKVSGVLYIEQGNTQSVDIEAKSSTLEKIIAEVKDGKLSIRFEKRNYFFNNFDAGKIIIHVTAPEINGLAISGSGDIIAKKSINTNNLSLAISGSGDIKLSELKTEKVKASISGSGDIIINDGGIAEKLSIAISGSGNVKTAGFETKDVKVKISGSGNSTVHATDNLNIRVAGSGDVYYKGSPNIDSSVAGSGNVKKIK